MHGGPSLLGQALGSERARVILRIRVQQPFGVLLDHLGTPVSAKVTAAQSYR